MCLVAATILLNMKELIDRIGGPTVSVLIHVIIFVVLLKVLVFRAPEKERAIEVQVLEEQVRKPEETEQQQEKAEPVES